MATGVITAALRRAVRESGQSLTRIEAATGVQRASLGQRSLRLDVADKLAAYFGLTVGRTEPGSPGPGGCVRAAD